MRKLFLSGKASLFVAAGAQETGEFGGSFCLTESAYLDGERVSLMHRVYVTPKQVSYAKKQSDGNFLIVIEAEEFYQMKTKEGKEIPDTFVVRAQRLASV